MILLSKASSGFTELGWSAQLFLVREFCKFTRYLALPVLICPMLCMEKYYIHPNTTHKNGVIQKLLAKSEGKLKPGRGLKDLLSRAGCQFLPKHGARCVWQEECLIFACLTGRQALLVGQCLCLWNHLPSHEGKRHPEGDSPSPGAGWEHPGASCEALVVLQVQGCSCRDIWRWFLDILFCSLAKW